MERQTFKNSLIGSLEMLIMMPTVLDRFTARKDDALRSFLFPLLLYPFVLWSFSVVNGTQDPVAFGLHALTAWGGLLGFYGIIFYTARWQGKIEHFWQYVNMANTQAILSFFLLIPIFLMSWNNAAHGPFFDQYWLFFILVDLVISAFVVTKALRLNWYLGGFFAVIGLFISDVGSQVVQTYLDS